MHDLCGETFTLQIPANYFSERDGTMPSASAPQRDRQITLPFANVVRNQKAKKALDLAQELTRLRKRTDVTRNAPVLSAERTQTWNEMRIGKKTHIKNEIRIRGNSIAEAEANDGNKQRALTGFLKAIDNELPQFVDVEFRGVNDDIGKAANRRHAPALFANAVGNREPVAERMRTARLAKAAHERFVTRFDEHERRWVSAGERTIKNRQLFNLLALARIDEQRRAFNFAAALVVELAENGDQRDREIINAIEAQVLERIQDRALTGARKAGEDDKLT